MVQELACATTELNEKHRPSCVCCIHGISTCVLTAPGVTSHRHSTAVQLQRRADDLQESWQRQRATFLQTATSSLAEASCSTAAAAEVAAARLSNAVSRQLLHDQLSCISAIKQHQQEQAVAEEAAAAAVQAAQAVAEAAAQQQRSVARKVLVAQYKQRVEQQQLEVQAEVEQLQHEAALAANAAIEASRPAVAARQAEALQRLQQQHEQQQQQAEAAAARQQRLAAISAALGPKLDRDPARVRQPTAASAAAAPAVGQAFRPVHGFTSQQVVADPRFRLVEALRGAGVMFNGGASSVGYLKQAMARLQ